MRIDDFIKENETCTKFWIIKDTVWKYNFDWRPIRF